jgi:hypothetical protein
MISMKEFRAGTLPGSTPAFPPEAMLQSLIEATLAEMAGEQKDAALPEPVDSSRQDDRFLARAAAYLRGRPDREALLDRLRALTRDSSLMDPPPIDPPPASSAQEESEPHPEPPRPE